MSIHKARVNLYPSLTFIILLCIAEILPIIRFAPITPINGSFRVIFLRPLLAFFRSLTIFLYPMGEYVDAAVFGGIRREGKFVVRKIPRGGNRGQRTEETDKSKDYPGFHFGWHYWESLLEWVILNILG